MAIKRRRAENSVRKRTKSPRPEKTERHLGATEDEVADRAGSGVGYDYGGRKKKPPKGGVASF